MILNKPRRSKKYARTVHDEEERKLDFSSNNGYSNYMRGESYTSSHKSDQEDRIKPYDPSIHSKNSEKYYNIENVKDEDNTESLNHKSRHRKHKRNKSSLIKDDSKGNGPEETEVKEEDRHIMISEKYSIEVANTDSKPTPPKFTEESNENYQNFRKNKEKYFEENSLRRNQFFKDKIKYVKENEDISEDEVSEPEKSNIWSNRERVATREHNNNDLDSVINSNYDNTTEKSKDKINKNDKRVSVFSDLSKDLNNKAILLSQTLDHASMAKLRRVFGSEQLLREYKTSEEISNLDSIGDHGFDEQLRVDNFHSKGIRGEIWKENMMDFHEGGMDAPLNLV